MLLQEVAWLSQTCMFQQQTCTKALVKQTLKTSAISTGINDTLTLCLNHYQTKTYMALGALLSRASTHV